MSNAVTRQDENQYLKHTERDDDQAESWRQIQENEQVNQYECAVKQKGEGLRSQHLPDHAIAAQTHK